MTTGGSIDEILVPGPQSYCYQHGRRTTVLQVVTLIAGSKRRSLLIAADDDEMFTPKTTEQHLIVRKIGSLCN